MVDAALQPRRVDVDDQAHAVVHRHRERLRAAHPAAAAGDRQRPRQRAAEPLRGDRGERLVGSLQDPLGADVDPRARGHLAVHRQAEALEPAELLPGRPVRHEVGVRDQHARRPLVRAHDADRLARLHQQRLVVAEALQRPHDRVERRPVARGPAGAAVDDEVVGALGDLGVEVVHQHPHRGLLLPAAAGQRRAARGADRAGTGDGGAHRDLSADVACWCRGAVASGQGADGGLGGGQQRRRRRPAPRRPRSPGTGSGPGPGPRPARAAPPRPPRCPRPASSGARRSSARAAVRISIASTRPSASTLRRSLRAADQPIETWSSCIADDGIESTLAGAASRFISRHQRGLRVLRDHVPGVDARVVGQERRQPVRAGDVEHAGRCAAR